MRTRKTKSRAVRLAAIMIAIMMVFCLCPEWAFAEEMPAETSQAEGLSEETAADPGPAEIVEVETVPDLAEEIQNDPSEAYIEIAPEEKQEYEETGLYAVEEHEDGTTEAVSVYSRKRLIVMDTDEITDTYGATKVVLCDDFQILLYDDEQATKDAYVALQEVYGDAVIIDQPVCTQASAAAGWGTDYMNLGGRSEAIAQSGTGAPVRVAVLDTGITPEHEIFARTNTTISKDSCCVVDGYSRTDFRDDVPGGHGTATAGIIAESTPDNVELLIIKVLDANGDGGFLDVYSGLRIALDAGADIVNMSLGGTMYEETASGLAITGATRTEITFLENILGRLVAAGTTVVCSAGNDNCDIDEWQVYPAKSDKTIAVGAIDKYDRLADYSNTGRAVDYVAPGVGVKAATNAKKANGSGNPYVWYTAVDGTSFSAPYVTAAAALIKETAPGANQNQVMAQLDVISKDLGAKGWDALYGYGVPIFGSSDRSVRTVRPAASEATPITGATVTGIKDRNYTGKALAQSPTVRLNVAGHTVTLQNGTDYTLSYRNNTNVGTATVTITGTGLYSGTVTRNFRVRAHGLCNGPQGWGVYKSGSIDKKATGLYQDAASRRWYMIRKGKHNKSFVGVAKSVSDGKWYFVRKGTRDNKFTGVAKSVKNGKWYFVRKGKLDWKYTGGARSVKNGKWYAVKKGRLNWKFKGKLKGTDGKRRRYVKGRARK